jgi:xylan 1,4-beta-xylosidase
MILAWYEKLVDSKDYLLFNKSVYSCTTLGEHPPHFHKGIELTIALSGESEVFINGVTYPFTEGTVCFVNSLDTHKYRFTQGASRYVVVISPDVMKAVGWDTETVFSSITTDPCVFSELKCFLDLAYRNWNGEEILMRDGFSGMLLALIKSLLPRCEKAEKNSHSTALKEILTYVSGNSEKPLTVDTVASHFGYSPNYFSYFFKKLTNVTFKEYLNFCRVVSYQRLRERDAKISVAEAAERCGFGSVKSLYRACKRSREMRTYYA